MRDHTVLPMTLDPTGDEIYDGNGYVYAIMKGRDMHTRRERGIDLIRKINAHDDLLAACEMQALSQNRVNGKWADELETLMRSCGLDGEEVGELFIRRFRDAAIKKAKS
jgi:hypothetical protein